MSAPRNAIARLLWPGTEAVTKNDLRARAGTTVRSLSETLRLTGRTLPSASKNAANRDHPRHLGSLVACILCAAKA